MSAKNPRINVTFEEEIAIVLFNLATSQHKSVSKIVRELAMEALEMREDLYFSQLAEEIEKKNNKTYSHSDAWK